MVEDVPEGLYTIEFDEVIGYVTPSSQSSTLIGGGTITFSGNYTPCTSHVTKKCSDGDVYWYDSCNNREDKFEDMTYLHSP